MFKKRAMSEAKWVSELAEQFLAQLIEKRLETGYADNQPKYPYWVRPRNYSYTEWDDMRDWMIDTMGHSDWVVKHARWVGSDQKYWFRDERDRTMFILRWS
jgi:hypothetical protein